MEIRPLGRTGFSVSVLGLGTVKLGRSEGVKYPSPVVIPSDAQAAALIHAAMDLGLNLIDTAPAYGNSEERLGVLLKDVRDRWVIATKAGEEFQGGVSRFDFSPRAIVASAERSLRRLNCGVIDILLIHSDGAIEHRLEESGVLDALRSLKQRGIVRSYGVSTKTLEGARAGIASCDVVMLTLNPVATQDLPAVHEARERGVGVLIKKALGSGHALIQDGRADSLEATLGFSVTTPGVSSVVVGTTSIENLTRNVRAAKAACGGGIRSESDPNPKRGTSVDR